MSIALANRYADALREVLAQPSAGTEAGAALAQLDRFGEIVEDSRDLRTVFASPAVSLADKRAVIKGVAEKLGLSAPVRNFLFVLADNGRLDLLRTVRTSLRERMDAASGIARVAITSAKGMPDDQQTQLLGRFQQMLGREVRASFLEDEGLLGGIQVRHGSTVYDGSVRAQLARLQRGIAGEV